MIPPQNIFVQENLSLWAFVTLSPFSFVPILFHRSMQSIEDSAKIHSMADDEEAFMGTADESKAPKGPTVGPSTSKRKWTEQNANDKEADAPKKRRGGRQPLKNTAELVSHYEYNRVPGEDSTQRKGCVQKIWRHWVRKWFNY
jgi:hypothetical protein